MRPRAVELVLAFAVPIALCGSAFAGPTSLQVVDYATLPMTGAVTSPPLTANAGYLARVNALAEEPGAAHNRLFASDLNGPLYIIDKNTRSFTEYLNFNGRDGRPGLFDRFTFATGDANGLVTFEFDPDYATNGKFYSVHIEEPNGALGSQTPDTTNYPNVDATNFGVTSPVLTPGSLSRQSVLLEWTDTNIANTAFEGSVRELLRIDMQAQDNPIADLAFNPAADSSDADWRMLYVAVGDGEAGKSGLSTVRRTPQLLSTMGGKILRIRADNVAANATLALSPNSKYYIPTDNPFTSVGGAQAAHVRDEVWALGLHDATAIHWDLDPLNPADKHLFVNDGGINTWEEVNLVRPGRNFGYSMREGNEELDGGNSTSSLPNPDEILNHRICAPSAFTTCTSEGFVTPDYPALQYGHALPADSPQPAQDNTFAGDSIASGFVYRGMLIPALYGKYIFGDANTGRIFYAEVDDLLAADDGDLATLADVHEISLLWDNPNDTPNDGEELYTTINTATSPGSDHTVVTRGPMHQIVTAAYDARGGLDPNLPGTSSITGTFGRAEVRLAVDAAGELYVLSKSDGMIRALVGPPAKPGDFNYDNIVDGADFNNWKNAYGEPLPYAGWGADGNGDGVVNALDYVIWRNLMEGGAGGISEIRTAVPEAGGTTLLLLAMFSAIASRFTRPAN